VGYLSCLLNIGFLLDFFFFAWPVKILKLVDNVDNTKDVAKRYFAMRIIYSVYIVLIELVLHIIQIWYSPL
jgi:hypothetical protein